ncbi:MAG: hypothetical protein FJX57_04555 [Alphaproteobacteria bacterium]|nr:hypothetical protein [Alphaproteobacteria bacterium]
MVLPSGERPDALVARSYVDEPGAAHFLRIEVDGVPARVSRDDLRPPLVIAAARRLRAAGKTQRSWLSGRGGGNEPIDATE